MQLSMSNLVTLALATAFGTPWIAAVPRSKSGWLLAGLAVSTSSFVLLAMSMPRELREHNLLTNAYLLLANLAVVAFVVAFGVVVHAPTPTGWVDALGFAFFLVFSIVVGGALSLVTAIIGMRIKRKAHLHNVYIMIPGAIFGLVLCLWAWSALIG